MQLFFAATGAAGSIRMVLATVNVFFIFFIFLFCFGCNGCRREYLHGARHGKRFFPLFFLRLPRVPPRVCAWPSTRCLVIPSLFQEILLKKYFTFFWEADKGLGTHTYTHTHTHINTHTHKHTHTHTHTNTHTNTHMFTYMYVCVYVCARACTHAQAHTHKHTHTHTHGGAWDVLHQ